MGRNSTGPAVKITSVWLMVGSCFGTSVYGSRNGDKWPYTLIWSLRHCYCIHLASTDVFLLPLPLSSLLTENSTHTPNSNWSSKLEILIQIQIQQPNILYWILGALLLHSFCINWCFSLASSLSSIQIPSFKFESKPKSNPISLFGSLRRCCCIHLASTDVFLLPLPHPSTCTDLLTVIQGRQENL